MKCRNCGQIIDDRTVVCPFCNGKTGIDEKESAIFEECARAMESQDDQSFIEDTKTFQKPSVGAEQEVSATISIPAEEIGEKKKWNYKPLLIGVLIAIALIGSALFAAYFAYNKFMGSSTKEYRNSAGGIQVRINKANADFVAVLNKDTKTLQVNDILTQIPKTTDTFDKIIKDYNDITPPASSSSSNSKLGEALNLNKQLYQTLQIILKSPSDSQTQKNMELLSSQIDQCMNSYSLVGIKGIDFALPGDVLSLPVKIGPWVKEKQAEYSQVMTLIAGYTKYFDNMSRLFVSFQSARVDFNSAVISVRNNQSTWDSLFTQIDNSEKILKGIQTDYGKLSVPSELKTINKAFAPILTDSLLYLSKLRFAAQTEKNFIDDSLTPEQITKKNNDISALYQDAEKTNSTVLMNYQKYTSDLKGEQDRYLDPEYVLSIKTKK
jgi:hypothetical protein